MRPVTRILAVLVLSLLVGPASAAAPSLEGHWEGGIDLPTGRLEVDLDFRLTDGGWAGDITIPAQMARDLPLGNVKIEGNRAYFAIREVPGDPTFQGTFAEDGRSISGTFIQGGASFPFSLTSGENEGARAAKALDGIREVIDAALADWKVPGLSLAVVVDGQVVLTEGYGLRDVEAKRPVTGKTLFAIGSSTKAFTAATLATLVDEGKVKWDEPVATYLPGFALYDEHASSHLTPRDTVTHRSGLPRHDLVWYGDETTTRADLVRRLRFLPPNKDLRELWQYNNLMFLTAGYLTEVVTGTSWEAAVRERLLDPLGMTRSNFDVAVSQRDDDHALPYQEKDDAIVKIPFRSITVMGPAGSINSSAADLARWMLMNLGGGRIDGKAVVGEGTLRELHTPQMAIPAMPDEAELSPMSYAMGWFTESWRGKWRVHHGGNIDGFSVLVTLFPRDGVGIAVLTNRNGNPLPELVTFAVADRIFGFEGKDWIAEAAGKRDAAKAFVKEAEKNKARFRVEGTKPAHPLSAYAGAYAHPGYGTVAIEEAGEALVARYHGMRLPLVHWHYETWNVEAGRKDEVIPEDLRVTFVTDASGRVTALESPFEPAVDPVVFSKEADRRLRDPAYLARLAGEYALPGQVLSIEVRGDRLVLRVPGQPAYDLEPSGPDEFRLTVVEGYRVRFAIPETGPAKEAILIQPDGVYPAARR